MSCTFSSSNFAFLIHFGVLVSPEQNYFDVNVTMKFYPENSSLINASQTWTTVHTDYSHMQMKKVFDKVPCLASQDPVNIIIFNHEDDSTPNEGLVDCHF